MRSDRVWQGCFALCCLLLIAPLWVCEFPPLVDLPQHAMLLAIGRHWSDGAYDYAASLLDFNYLSNSVLLYALDVRARARCCRSWRHSRSVLSLSLLGLPVVTLRLVQAVGGDRWWIFAVFPAAYGYAFMWGFFTFIVAIPFGLLVLLAAIRYRQQPSTRRAVLLGAAVYTVFLCHILVLAYVGLSAFAIVVTAPTRRDKHAGVLALGSVIPLAVARWIASTRLDLDLHRRRHRSSSTTGPSGIPLILFSRRSSADHGGPDVGASPGALVLTRACRSSQAADT